MLQSGSAATAPLFKQMRMAIVTAGQRRPVNIYLNGTINHYNKNDIYFPEQLGDY
jgi:hypothetical protein